MPGPNPSATITYTYTVDPRIRCDKDYMKSLEGIMKLVTQVSEISITSIEWCLLNNCNFLNKLLALGCIISASVVDFKNSREGEFYISVASSLLSYTGIMSAMYNFHVCEKFHKLPWLKIEVILMSIFLVCLIIASVLAVTEPKKLSVASVSDI